MKNIVVIFCLLVVSHFGMLVNAADFVFDEFNDGVLSLSWNSESSTYSLLEAGGTLHVAYNRTSATGEWDQFSLGAIDHQIGSNSIIKLQIRSTVSLSLAIKPVNQNGSDAWVTKSIPGDSTFHDYYINLNFPEGTQMETVFFYFDPDSGKTSSGVVELDNLFIGFESDAPANPVSLELAVEAANAYLERAHDRPSKEDAGLIRDALEVGRTMLANTWATQVEVSTAAEALFDAMMVADSHRGAGFSSSLTDGEATLGARRLYANLKWFADNGLSLFGMHDQTAYGVGADQATWHDDGTGSRSDIKTLTGTHGAIFSWDVNQIVNSPFEGTVEFRKLVMQGAAGNGVTTFAWHMGDPVFGKFYPNEFGDPYYKVVPTLLEGGAHHEWYKNQLQKVAFFFKSLRDDQGRLVPVIFRPFHEHNSPFFWWGTTHCTEAEYKDLWQFTISYLRNDLGMHSLIYAFSPDAYKWSSPNVTEYKYGYPGDDYIDIIGTDFYFGVGDSYERNYLTQRLAVMTAYADSVNKVAALTEVGDGWDSNTLHINNWYTNSLLACIKASEATRRLAYVATWRNASSTHFFVPYEGHSQADDFIAFYNDPTILFVEDITDLSVSDRREGIRVLSGPESGENAAVLKVALPFSGAGIEHSHDMQYWSDLLLPDGKLYPEYIDVPLSKEEGAVFVREK